MCSELDLERKIAIEYIEMYAPTESTTEEEMKTLYTILQEIIRKQYDSLIVIEDWNIRVGKGKTQRVKKY